MSKTKEKKETKPIIVSDKEQDWEIKDRIYYLKGDKTPLTLTIPGKHTKKHAFLTKTNCFRF